MSLIRIEQASKSFAGLPVLDAVDFRIEKGEKVGLIGRNGSGKSTLFKLISGELKPDAGVVERMRRAKFAYLSQMPDVPPDESLIDVVLDYFRELAEMEIRLRALEKEMGEGSDSALESYGLLEEEFRRRGGYEFRTQVKRVLHGLGFSEEEFQLPFEALSGGQRTRLMLALLLLEDADILLLDEPENHLDLRAREWLEVFLKEYPRAFVIISHDRHLLNAVTMRTVEIERGSIRGYTGNYDAYMQNRAMVREQTASASKRQQAFIDREQKWIDRFKYKNTKSRQAQSRIKRLKKLERIVVSDSAQDAPLFNLGGVARSGQKVLEARDLSMRYDDLELYSGLSFDIERGERVGIIGPNGSGKTTLLRQIAGRLEGATGTVTLGHKVVAGFYDQHQDSLNSGNDILEELNSVRPDLKQGQLRSFLARFLFKGEDVLKPVSELSGGERSRVALAKLVLGKANLIFLDEPTNHLDIVSREALEESLCVFAGTLVLISHDRNLIDRLVDKLIVFEEDRVTVHLGNYTHYKWKLANDHQVRAERETRGDALNIRKPRTPTDDRMDRKARERELRKNRRTMKSLEEKIVVFETRIAECESEFGRVDPADHSALADLTKDYEGLKADLKALYAEWERLSATLSS